MDIIDLTNSPPSSPKAARPNPTPAPVVEAQPRPQSPVVPQLLRADIGVLPESFVRPQSPDVPQLLRADVDVLPQSFVRPQSPDVPQLMRADVDVFPQPVVHPQSDFIPHLLKAEIGVRPEPHVHRPVVARHLAGSNTVPSVSIVNHRNSVMKKLRARGINGDDVMAINHYYVGGRLISDDWTEAEHELFVMGVIRYGKGSWARIAREYVITKTPQQVSKYGQGLYGPPPRHYPGIFTSTFKRIWQPPIIPKRPPSLNSNSPEIRPFRPPSSTPSDPLPMKRCEAPNFDDIFNPVFPSPVGLPKESTPPNVLTLAGRHAHPTPVPSSNSSGVLKQVGLIPEVGLPKQPTLVAPNSMDLFKMTNLIPEPTLVASNSMDVFKLTNSTPEVGLLKQPILVPQNSMDVTNLTLDIELPKQPIHVAPNSMDVFKLTNLPPDVGLPKQPTLEAPNSNDVFKPVVLTAAGLPKQPTLEVSNGSDVFMPVVQTPLGVPESPQPRLTLPLFPVELPYCPLSAEKKRKRNEPIEPEELENLKALAPSYWTLALGRRSDKDDVDTSND